MLVAEIARQFYALDTFMLQSNFVDALPSLVAAAIIDKDNFVCGGQGRQRICNASTNGRTLPSSLYRGTAMERMGVGSRVSCSHVVM